VKTRFFPASSPLTEPERRRADLVHLLRRARAAASASSRDGSSLLGCGMVDPAVFASVTEARRKINPADDAYNPEKNQRLRLRHGRRGASP